MSEAELLWGHCWCFLSLRLFVVVMSSSSSLSPHCRCCVVVVVIVAVVVASDVVVVVATATTAAEATVGVVVSLLSLFRVVGGVSQCQDVNLPTRAATVFN